MRIGIDIGNVIIGGGGEDTFFTDEFLETPEVDGAQKSIDSIVYGPNFEVQHEVHFISKCGKTVEEKTMAWLYYYKWYYQIDNQRVHFVRKRHLKAPMAQALELDIFIDDRQDVLDAMEGIVEHRILFTSWEDTNKQLKEIFETA